MKLNHMICPTCGHDFYTDAAYATCDACHTMFYAASSRTCHAQATSSEVTPLQRDIPLPIVVRVT